MLLNTYRRRRHQSHPGDYKSARAKAKTSTDKVASSVTTSGIKPRPNDRVGDQPVYATPPTNPEGGATQRQMGVAEAQTKFDEYGTELHRDARVWKVYVQEADKYDAELVKEWNDSTDVILIFAALFSAISTAFLIESSKMLQENPADESARTLATISQTLLALADGTQQPGPVGLPANNNTGFIPSRTAVYVNTLWYLSLSLSLATSLIAILSKDWCHSFMSNRTGHPYSQTCRRQQKWDMLERWKMSELLPILPSLIHVALLRPFKYLVDLLVPIFERLGDTETNSSIMRVIIFRPSYKVWDWLTDRRLYDTTTTEWINTWFAKPHWRLEWTKLDNITDRPGDKYGLGAEEQTSFALSWLIKNCEVPQSVDIALQSIAGASTDFNCEPLLECNAALEILRRLASGNLYRDGNAETVVSLYSRALSFLSLSASKNSRGERDDGDNLEVMIWNMQRQVESNVAELIADGQFEPKRQNLDALRIGNTAASRGLQLLKGDIGGANQLFNSIIILLEQHSGKAAPLHPAALLSLVNATALLSLLSNEFPAIFLIRKICRRLASDEGYVDMPWLTIALITCTLIQRVHTHQPHPRGHLHIARTIQTLTEFQSDENQSLRAMLEFGLEDPWRLALLENLDNNNSEVLNVVPSRLSSQFLARIYRLLTGDEYDSTPSQMIHILHGLHPFAPANSNSSRQRKPGDELIGLVWDLHMEMEHKLPNLISDGNFKPTPSNLEALHIGSTMGLISAKILKRQLKNTDIKQIFDSVIKLLKLYLVDRATTLHDAALLSLIQAAALLLLFAPTSVATRPKKSEFPASLLTTSKNFPEILGKLEHDDALILLLLSIRLADHPSGLITSLATTCILLYNRDHTQPTGSTWLEEVVRGFIERYSQNEDDLRSMYKIESLGITSPKQGYDLEGYISRLDNNFLSNHQTKIYIAELENGAMNTSSRDIVVSQLGVLSEIYLLTSVTMINRAVYLFVVEAMCHAQDPTSTLWACGVQMLSKCHFPILSEELATGLDQRELVPLLEAASMSNNQTKRFFAIGHLWLLLSLYIYPPHSASGREKLKTHLDTCSSRGSGSMIDWHKALGEQLWRVVYPDSTIVRELGVWAWRLNECVLQSRELPVAHYMRDALRDVSPELRGLSSFSGWPRRADDPPIHQRPLVGAILEVERERTESTGDTSSGRTWDVALTRDTEEPRAQGPGCTVPVSSRENLEPTEQVMTHIPEDVIAEATPQDSEVIDKMEGKDCTKIWVMGNAQGALDAGETMKADELLRVEGEDAQKRLGQDGGDDADVFINMGRLETNRAYR